MKTRFGWVCTECKDINLEYRDTRVTTCGGCGNTSFSDRVRVRVREERDICTDSRGWLNPRTK